MAQNKPTNKTQRSLEDLKTLNNIFKIKNLLSQALEDDDFIQALINDPQSFEEILTNLSNEHMSSHQPLSQLLNKVLKNNVLQQSNAEIKIKILKLTAATIKKHTEPEFKIIYNQCATLLDASMINNSNHQDILNLATFFKRQDIVELLEYKENTYKQQHIATNSTRTQHTSEKSTYKQNKPEEDPYKQQHISTNSTRTQHTSEKSTSKRHASKDSIYKQHTADETIYWDIYRAFTSQQNNIKELIGKMSNVNYDGDNTHNSLLYLASIKDSWDIVEWLLAQGADPNLYPSGRNSPLLLAINSQQTHVATQLIKHKAKINMANSDQITPLSHAINSDQWEIVDLLLDKDANPNLYPIEQTSPLILAINSKQENIAKKIINNKADVNIADKKGLTPLLYASNLGQWDVVELLLDKNANPNLYPNNYTSPLSLAIVSKQPNVVKKLIQHGAKVNTVANGIPPLLHAAHLGQWDIVDLLLDHNADPNLYASDQDSPLLLAVNSKQPKIVEKLIKHGAKVNTSNSNGISPLMHAANLDQWEIVNMLILAGAEDPNALIIKRAIQKNQIHTLGLLLKSKISQEDRLAIYKLQDKFFAHISNDDQPEFMTSMHLNGYYVNTFAYYLLNLTQELREINPIAANTLAQLNKQLELIAQSYNLNYPDLIQQALTNALPNEPVAFMAGMDDHLIVGELKQDGHEYILTLHNSGAGREFHASQANTNLISSSLTYRIPKHNLQSENIRELIKLLLPPRFSDKKCATTLEFYNNLDQFVINTLHAKYIKEHRHYTKGQRGNTCAWKGLMAFIKNSIENDFTYLTTKYEIKLDALNLYFKQQKANCRLEEELVRSQLTFACENLVRLMEKVKSQSQNENDPEKIAHINTRLEAGLIMINTIRKEIGLNDLNIHRGHQTRH